MENSDWEMHVTAIRPGSFMMAILVSTSRLTAMTILSDLQRTCSSKRSLQWPVVYLDRMANRARSSQTYLVLVSEQVVQAALTRILLFPHFRVSNRLL